MRATRRPPSSSSDLEALTPDGHPLAPVRPAAARSEDCDVALAGALVVVLAGSRLVGVAHAPRRRRRSPEPVSVLIANFQNDANEPLFDGLVEQALGVGIEGASFVSAYPRRDALRLVPAVKRHDARRGDGQAHRDPRGDRSDRERIDRPGRHTVQAGRQNHRSPGARRGERDADPRHGGEGQERRPQRRRSHGRKGPQRPRRRHGGREPGPRRRNVHRRLARGGARVRARAGAPVGGEVRGGDRRLQEGARSSTRIWAAPTPGSERCRTASAGARRRRSISSRR